MLEPKLKHEDKKIKQRQIVRCKNKKNHKKDHISLQICNSKSLSLDKKYKLFKKNDFIYEIIIINENIIRKHDKKNGGGIFAKGIKNLKNFNDNLIEKARKVARNTTRVGNIMVDSVFRNESNSLSGNKNSQNDFTYAQNVPGVFKYISYAIIFDSTDSKFVQSLKTSMTTGADKNKECVLVYPKDYPPNYKDNFTYKIEMTTIFPSNEGFVININNKPCVYNYNKLLDIYLALFEIYIKKHNLSVEQIFKYIMDKNELSKAFTWRSQLSKWFSRKSLDGMDTIKEKFNIETMQSFDVLTFHLYKRLQKLRDYYVSFSEDKTAKIEILLGIIKSYFDEKDVNCIESYNSNKIRVIKEISDINCNNITNITKYFDQNYVQSVNTGFWPRHNPISKLRKTLARKEDNNIVLVKNQKDQI